jgi:hypothetical protein
MKKIRSVIGISLFNIIIVLAGGCGLVEEYNISDVKQYQTTHQAKYYKENIAKHSMLVMPKEIEDFFIVEKYCLLYQKWEGNHEEYLEIRIEDEGKYNEYIGSIIGNKVTEEFFYDKTYQEYVINDKITLDIEKQGYLYCAEVQKILFSEKENRIVFYSMFIYPNGPVNPSQFYYFERFDIQVDTYYNDK